MTGKWRFLDTGIHDCRYNMALDEAISISRSQNKVPNTLRFYRWNPSVVSIGYFQSMKNEVDIHACDKRKIDYIRRITGGGAVYHDTNGELTYSIIVDGQHRLISKDFQDTYKKLCEGLVKGLSYLNKAIINQSECESIIENYLKRAIENNLYVEFFEFLKTCIENELIDRLLQFNHYIIEGFENLLNSTANYSFIYILFIIESLNVIFNFIDLSFSKSL